MWLYKAEKYIADPNNLYQQFKKESFTRDLEVMTQFSLDDAGAVRVQSKSFTGAAQNYDGYGSVSTTAADLIRANTGWIIYQLDQKKYYGLPIDKIEAEESLNLFISQVNWLVKTMVTVDIDTYRLSKLSSEASVVVNGAALPTGTIDQKLVGSGNDLDKTNVLPTIETCLGKMQNEEVTTDNYILYTTPAVAITIEDADKIVRIINVREVDRDGAKFNIRSISTSNGTADIIIIPDRYFHLFTHGDPTHVNQAGTNLNTVGAIDTGFRFLLVARSAINAVVKVNHARIMPEGTIRGFLGDLFELFIYHDIFTIERRRAVAVAADIDPVTFLAPKAFNGVIKCSL